MESVQPPAGSQVSRVPAQRPPSDHLAPPGPAPAPEPPRRRIRTVLTVVAAVLTSLVLGGIVAGYLLYDRATAPDRSAPDVVVANYLQSRLVSRNANRAELFTCGSQLPDIEAFLAQIEQRERELSVGFAVNIENMAVSRTTATSATVTVVIRRSAVVDGVQQSLTNMWSFDVEDREGWRVCGGSQVN